MANTVIDFRIHKTQENYRVAERLAASQEGLDPTELVS
jgi:hypothetical protein